MKWSKKRTALLMFLLILVPYTLPRPSPVISLVSPVQATSRTGLGIWNSAYNSSATANSSITVGTLVQLRVNASGGAGLNGFDITVGWDQTVLNGTGVSEKGGIFAGPGFFVLAKEIARDHVRLAGITTEGTVANGTVFFFNVTVLAVGSTAVFIPPHLPSPIPAGYTSISGGGLNNLPYESLNGFFSNDPTKSDLVLSSVSLESEVVTKNETLAIVVTVKNAGPIPIADTTITVYANETLVDSANLALIAPDTRESVTIVWDTTLFSIGLYNITATVATTSPDAYPDDNRQSVETVRVVIHDLKLDSVTVTIRGITVNTLIVNTTDARVTAVVSNIGTIQDVANVTVYANNTKINTIVCQPQCSDSAPRPVSVDAGRSSPFIFTWNTTGLALGRYNITAQVSTVAGENSLTNNNFLYGLVIVKGGYDHDLGFLPASFPQESIKQGENKTFSFVVKNNGVSNEGYMFKLYIINQTNNIVALLNETSGTIPPFQQIAFFVNWNTKGFAAGTYDHAVANVTTAVDENPSNNQVIGRLVLAANLPLPTAAFVFAPLSPLVGVSIFFNANSSSDPDGIHYYFWDFGDGTRSTLLTSTASHVYSSTGTFTVTLTVWDKYGAQATTTKTVTVTAESPIILYVVIGVVVAVAAAGTFLLLRRRGKRTVPKAS